MLHNQVAINVSTAIQAKGTDKRKAYINVCSGIGFIQHFGKSKCGYDNLEKVEGRADKMQSNARQSTIS